MGLRRDAKGFMRDSNTSEADSWEVRLERSCGFSGPSKYVRLGAVRRGVVMIAVVLDVVGPAFG